MTGQLLRLADILQQYGVKFVIIDGHAVNAHGFARATEDVDFVFDRSSSEQDLTRALESVNAFWIGDTIDPADGFRQFRGRDVDTGALLRKRGFPE